MNISQAIAEESLPHHVGIFSRFPRGRASCITCPPGRSDPLIFRVLWRAILIFCLLRYIPGKLIPTRLVPNRFIPKSRFAIILLAVPALLLLGFPALLYGLVAESVIETLATGKENMSTVVSALLVLALIAVPSYLMSKTPGSYNVPTQIMFSVFLTAASTWLGVSINNKRARRDATAKWLPAAETACKQLLTLSATTERMKRTQAQACNAVDPIISEGDQKSLKALRVLIALQCRETAEKLATLRDHIENGISLWQVFIGTNCEGDECSLIDARLKECRQQLFSQIDAERCVTSVPSTERKLEQISGPNSDQLPKP